MQSEAIPMPKILPVAGRCRIGQRRSPFVGRKGQDAAHANPGVEIEPQG